MLRVQRQVTHHGAAGREQRVLARRYVADARRGGRREDVQVGEIRMASVIGCGGESIARSGSQAMARESVLKMLAWGPGEVRPGAALQTYKYDRSTNRAGALFLPGWV